ncbi:PrsW family intramembrane metalloprotease [Methanoplanus sp. FWC-SCC4]|uniref:PrsW family intramembrane metalloprotease n=1 Tax=Methanochimaera problematica TaxID=2609417 RepID=A0AA97FCI9_9EURY|nr:ABC transporter permease [Methanoplanus sp. FWC-SCC4]WOF15548.1 PrsW family intramembrane metalloprotease [Methanoplanus sp. FWC-SCC4]
MTSTGHQIFTIAKWEIKRFTGTMSKEVLPIAVLLFILLIAATGLTQQSGIHMQDDMYSVAVDSDSSASIIAGDPRFSAYKIPKGSLPTSSGFDLVISDNEVYASNTEKGLAALKALENDYRRYKTIIYNREEDLFAAYPLWIEENYVKSEIDFVATQSGERAIAPPNPNVNPVPEKVPAYVEPPGADIGITKEELRTELITGENADTRLSRYTDVLAPSGVTSEFKTPAQLSPPLPFDTIILVFVFIFPLYFTSQFFMMSIMNERIERSGEALLATPVKNWAIIAGKGLPYLLMMIVIAVILTAMTSGNFIILLPIFPVILFFLAFALLIGMVSRSFKELSFISIFFSTVATSYIFFPSIFANIHIVSLISPLTLVIYQMQGDGFTVFDYIYSTSLFYLTSAVIFYIAAKNYKEEGLFNYHKLMPKLREFTETVISKKRTNLSFFGISIFTIPFVFMAQLMLLVLLFNLPMPLSLIFLLISAAFIEEFAKSVGIYTVFSKRPEYFNLKNIILASFSVALGFLIGEKLLLFATLAEISDSIFGAVLFTSLQVLWLPLSLHFIGVLTTTAVLKAGGRKFYIPALMASTVVHTLYNLYFILGWSG